MKHVYPLSAFHSGETSVHFLLGFTCSQASVPRCFLRVTFTLFGRFHTTLFFPLSLFSVMAFFKTAVVFFTMEVFFFGGMSVRTTVTPCELFLSWKGLPLPE